MEMTDTFIKSYPEYLLSIELRGRGYNSGSLTVQGFELTTFSTLVLNISNAQQMFWQK